MNAIYMICINDPIYYEWWVSQHYKTW